MSGTPPTVTVDDDQDDVDLDGPGLASLAATVLTAEDRSGELALHFVDRAAMAELNRTHMDGDGPTDVLAFPLDADPLDALPLGAGPLDADPLDAGGPTDDPDGPARPEVLLGDVVICPAVARGQADEHDRSVAAELELLVVHGVLHVCGWDHATPADEAAMQARERVLLGGRGR